MIPLLLAGGPPVDIDLPASIGLPLAIFLVLLNGFFVAAEFALVKVRTTQIEPYSDQQRGKITMHMIQHLDAYLSATQLGITLASLGLGWIGEPAVAWLFEPLFALLPGIPEPVQHSFSFTTAFLTISFLHIVLGELAPKSLAIRKPEPTSLWVSIPLFVFYKVTFPAIWLLNAVANALLRVFGIEPVQESELAHSEEEIRRLLASESDARIDDDKRELLDNVFELHTRIARQVMVPRADVVYLDINQPLEANLTRARESGHTRFPLCEDELDNVLGLVHIKDVFRAESAPESLDEIRRETFVVPETLSLEKLLRRMRREHIHMAAVVDEYGSVSGLVTLENVIEEIVGEIQDEFDAERPELVKLDDATYRVLGSMLIEDLEDALETELLDGREEDTVAGIVLSELGRTAETGDRVQVERLDFEVLEVDGNRIVAMKVELLPDSMEEAE